MTKDNGKMRGVRFLLIVLAGTVLSVILHQLHHDPLMTVSGEARSIVITSGFFAPAAFLSLAVAFCVMGLMFLSIQKALPGAKQAKGVSFGIAFGGMYLVGMIEAYVVYPVPLFGELFTGVADGCGIFLMSLLLGRYMADDTADGEAHPVFPAILIIPVVYVLIRYFSYMVVHVESSCSTRPLATFLWTAGMGCWIGIMHLLVGRTICPGSRLSQALTFGGLLFGVNWLIYNLFTVLFIEVSVLDLFYRCIFDSLAVAIGVYLSSVFSKRQVAPQCME